MPRGYTAPILGTYQRLYNRKFYSDEFSAYPPSILFRAPEQDRNEHVDGATGRPLCFKAWSSWEQMLSCAGTWWLTQPLDVATEMKGGLPRSIKGIEVKAEYRYGSGFVGGGVSSALLKLDNNVVLDRSLTAGFWNPNSNVISLNQDLANVSQLQIGLYEAAGAHSSWYELHLWELWLHGEYYLDTPPPTYSVEVYVYDESGYSIPNASVKLMTGTTVLATKTTDSSGRATIQAQEGSYALKIYASGYTPYPFEALVDLTTGNVLIEAPLIKSQGFDWTQYIPYIVAGGIGIAGIVGASYLIRGLKGKKEG